MRIDSVVGSKSGQLVEAALTAFGSAYLAVPVRAMLLMDYAEELLRWAVGPHSVGALLDMCTGAPKGW